MSQSATPEKNSGVGQSPPRKTLPKSGDRRARDLRDDAINSLFGAGLALDALVERLPDPDGKRALDTVVAFLDDAVRDVRLLQYAIDDPQS